MSAGRHHRAGTLAEDVDDAADGAAADLPTLMSAPCPDGCGTLGGVSNLITTAIGAGMVALPRAVSETGIVLGLSLFFLTSLLTLASTSLIVILASRYRTHTYADLIKLHFGRVGSTILSLAIILHVGGVMIG